MYFPLSLFIYLVISVFISSVVPLFVSFVRYLFYVSYSSLPLVMVYFIYGFI